MDGDALWIALGGYRGPARVHAFARYACGLFNDRQVARAFRTYAADSLRGIPRNEYLESRFDDLFDRPADFDAEQVVERVVAGGGLKARS